MTVVKLCIGLYQVKYVIQLPDMRYIMPICYLDNVSYIFLTYFCALHITYVLLYLLLYSMYYTITCIIIDDTGRTAHTQRDASGVCCGR